MKFVKVLLLVLSIIDFARTSYGSDNADIQESEVLKQYQLVQASLSHDKLADARKASDALEKLTIEWLKDQSPESPLTTDGKLIVEGSKKLNESSDMALARKAFGTLSQGIVQLIRHIPTLQAGWQLFFCPMTKEYGYWVQPMGEKITNPYFGSEMLHCGSKKKWTAF